jgi:uncharacterized integral membrane protein
MRREGPDEPIDRPVIPPDAGMEDRDIVEEVRVDREHLRALQRERRSRVVKAIIAISIVVILIVFIISNSQAVPVDFVFFTRRPALIWVMVACAIMGGIVGYLIGRPGKQIRFHRRPEDPNK